MAWGDEGTPMGEEERTEDWPQWSKKLPTNAKTDVRTSDQNPLKSAWPSSSSLNCDWRRRSSSLQGEVS